MLSRSEYGYGRPPRGGLFLFVPYEKGNPDEPGCLFRFILPEPLVRQRHILKVFIGQLDLGSSRVLFKVLYR